MSRLIRALSLLLLSLPLLLALFSRLVPRLERRYAADPEQNLQSDSPPTATPQWLHLALSWVLLLMLLAVEFGVSFLKMERTMRPLILLPAVLMVATVGIAFMQVRRGPTVVRLFATAGLMWLAILLGLGSMDPMTRTNYYVQDGSQK